MSEPKKRASPGDEAEAKRVKTETKPGAAYSKVFHQNVAPSCTRIDALELESHPRSELDWEQLHGMENIKQALGDHVLTPMQHPEFFALQPSFFKKRGQAGRIPFERVFALAGPYGMGRRRLVYNLCKSKAMTLFDVQPIQFDPFRDLGVIYEQAVAEAPSMVLFDTCEDHFFEHKPAVGKLHYHLNQITENKLPVWTVFLMHSRPSLLHADIRPPPECQLVTPMLHPAECSAVFDQALAERLDRAEDIKGAVGLVDPSVLLRCHMASKDYTPKEIHDWLDRVFKRALFNQRKALESCDRDDPIFYPVATDFSEMLFTVPGKLDTRLGRVDPATINILPYLSADEERHVRLNNAKAPMPMPVQNSGDYGFQY